MPVYVYLFRVSLKRDNEMDIYDKVLELSLIIKVTVQICIRSMVKWTSSFIAIALASFYCLTIFLVRSWQTTFFH